MCYTYKVMNEFLSKLNSEQIAPATDTEGAVLVFAGAGSGKTRVLTSRIAHLVQDLEVFPSSVLAITFTNKAANEMRERLQAMVGDVQGMWICTIHSMCVRILRRYADRRGYTATFSIYAEQERQSVIRQACAACGETDEKFRKNAAFHIAQARMLGQDPEEYRKNNRALRNIGPITNVYAEYCAVLKRNNALDFDDILNETRDLLAKDGEVLEEFGRKFRYIHVDEFQDTNRVQYEIIRMLASVNGNLFAVGDDDQSIYGWRGAQIQNILDFEKDFPGAKVYKLERNYRSTKRILDLANAAIGNNGTRKPKKLWTEKGDGEMPVFFSAENEQEEALYVAREIRKRMNAGASYSDFAVLMRVNALSRSFEQEFASYDIPFRVFGGFRFYERKEIKDLLAYMRVISNPFDSEAVKRIINVPKRGIGARTVEILEDYAAENGLSFYDALLKADGLPLAPSARTKVNAFAALLKKLVLKGALLGPDELVRDIITDTGIRTMYEEDTDENFNKKANIDEFINSVDDFCAANRGATLPDFLNQVTLSTDLDEGEGASFVSVATIHSVKGLEFGTVFLVGMEETVMPVSRADDDEAELEEERRLLYVAVTRAREMLYVTCSRSRYMYGSRSGRMPSRFLRELKAGMPEGTPERRSVSSGHGRGQEFYGRQSDYGGGSFRRRDGYDLSGGTWGGPVKRVSPSGSETSSPPGWRTISSGSDAGKIARAGRDAPPTGMRDTGQFQPGMRVLHPKFGEGVILSVEGDGSRRNADIRFEGYGVKKLALSIAPLEILRT